MKKIYSLLLLLFVCVMFFISCGSFGEGLLAGLTGYTGNGYNNYNSFGSGYSAPTTYSGSGSSVSSTSSKGGTSPSSSSRICKKLSATDNAHCNGNGKCSRCNGKGKYFDNSYGIPKTVDPCGTCGGSGKCPSCNGTGRRL